MVLISRRKLVSGLGLLAVGVPGQAFAQGAGLLARLRQAGVARVGIANQPPFSAMLPDGSMTGLAPTIAKRVLERLGIPRMEGAIATYGELIPGMFAGRWDFVAASLTLSKERCGQVLFSDPLSFEGVCIVGLKDKNSAKPQTLADLIRLGVKVGVQSGGAQFRQLASSTMAPNNIIQFNNDPAMFDGLMAGRVQYLWATHLPAVELTKRRQVATDIVFPVADSIAPGAANAFRKTDVDLYEAYQKELRAMKQSGEYLELATRFGFEIPPDLMHATADRQCEVAAREG